MQPSQAECYLSRAERTRCTRLCPRGYRLAVSWESLAVCTIVLEAVTLPCIAALVNRGLEFATLLHPPTRLCPLCPLSTYRNRPDLTIIPP